MYLLSDNSIASHVLWENNNIIKVWKKTRGRRVELDLSKDEISKLELVEVYNPNHIRDLKLFDNSRINAKKDLNITDFFTPRALKSIDLIQGEIEKFDGSLKRALLLILSASLGQMSKMVFAVSKRGKTTGKESEKIEVGSWVIGYWRPEKHFEINAWNCFENKARNLLKSIKEIGLPRQTSITSNLDRFQNNHYDAYVCVGDSEIMLKDIPSESVSVILTDPPHGDRIPYLELSEMWNSVLGLNSKYDDELVISNAKERGKDIVSYNKKLSLIFRQCSRVLRNDGLLAVMFNARSDDHWDSLHQLEEAAGLEYLGCYPMKYSAGSVVQDNRKGGLKTDYVLLYGKEISKVRKTNIMGIFNTLNEWSTNYPKKGR